MSKRQKISLIKIIISIVLTALAFIPLGNIYKGIMLFAAYIAVGYDVLKKAAINISHGQVFDENFLMAVASIGAFCTGELTEGVAVMLLYQIGELFQSYAVGKSRKSISELMDIRPDSANVLRDGEEICIDPDDVKIGETIVVKPGEKIPLDGVVEEGTSTLNTSALTGESAPRKVKEGDEILSGCINENGVLKIKVTKSFGESTVTKILELVENCAEAKTKTENFITKFAAYYTPVVVIGAVCLALIPPIFVGNIVEWVHRAMIFLVISCPCALVISVPLSYFSGIGRLSKNGVLVKGSNVIEMLAHTDTIAFDKTGTLTKGNFAVSKIYSPEIDEKDFIAYLAHAEGYSSHPIANAIKSHYGKEISKSDITDYKELAGYGVAAIVNGIMVCAGNEKLMKRLDIKYTKCEEIGTVVYMAVGSKFAGYAVISDEIKATSESAIRALKDVGVKNPVILTGDSKESALYVGNKLGIENVHYSLLPADKVDCVKELINNKTGNVAFVGDGINDAPVLAIADVGIAMGGVGSDAAIEAADAVIMDDDISKIAPSVKTARKTVSIVKQNIVFALAVKAIFLVLGGIGMANMWEAVFADVGVAILAILNAMRAMKEQI